MFPTHIQSGLTIVRSRKTFRGKGQYTVKTRSSGGSIDVSDASHAVAPQLFKIH
jgi:hypothetical protein